MVASKALFYAVAVVAVVLGNALAASEISQVKIWPMPASVSYGDARLYLSSDFGLSSDSESQILKDAFNRMLAVIKQDHVIDANFSAFNRSSLLQGLHIVVSSPDEQLLYGTDESYKLMVPSPEKPGYAHLEAKTVYGALHGLQIHNLSLWRYHLILNCGMALIHSQSDIQQLMLLKFYAKERGINVLAEIDVPGHALSWLKMHRMNESQAYQYFVLRAQKIALSHGYEIVNWEETFNDFGSKLSRKTVVHNWLGGGVAQRVVQSGLRCIVSNQDKWYLDHLDTPWEEFYQNEPLTNITNPKQQKLVIGGEVCMWGETVDGSDIEQTIWPRAAAAAERLWTPYDKLAKNPREVTGRLANFRCLLNERGVAAAPLAGSGRAAPFGPGSCYKQ
ncbi:hypothetical protein V6N13_131388 [Hibiscus sabdariffa]